MNRYFFSFPNTEEAFRISDDIFGHIIDTVDADISERQRMKLIVSELFMNAYLHGNKFNTQKHIDVALEIDVNEFIATVKDEGTGFTKQRFKKMVEAISDLDSNSGRGIKIIHELSDKINVFKDEKGKFCIRAFRKFKTKPVLINS